MFYSQMQRKPLPNADHTAWPHTVHSVQQTFWERNRLWAHTPQPCQHIDHTQRDHTHCIACNTFTIAVSVLLLQPHQSGTPYRLTLFHIQVPDSVLLCCKRLCIFRPQGAIQMCYYYYYYIIIIKQSTVTRNVFAYSDYRHKNNLTDISQRVQHVPVWTVLNLKPCHHVIPAMQRELFSISSHVIM